MAAGRGGLQLDTAGTRYAQLLVDPCRGPLVNAPFGDGQSGMVSRFETDLIVNATATETCAYLAFVPSTAQVFGTGTLLTTDTTTFTGNGAALAGPGAAFLSGTPSSFRGISACVQVMYPGSELTRAGVVSVGQMTCANIGGTTLSTSTLRGVSQVQERTPSTTIELKWRPNNYDMEYTQWASDYTVSTVWNKRSCIVVTAAGLPVNTGIRIRVILVAEWIPGTASGINIPGTPAVTSRNSMADVLRKLDGFGNWMYSSSVAAGRAASSLYAGGSAAYGLARGVGKLALMAA